MAKLTVRAPAIDIAALSVPSEWIAGAPFRSQLFNAMSMMFPIGEKFFIDAVREALPRVDDAEMVEEARRFIAQEAAHTRLHRMLNDKLGAHGLRFVVEPLQKWRVRTSQNFDVRSKLAITMAYEHFTAMLGDLLLERPEWLEGTCEPLRVLWMWHAVEECEHRALAFDVFRRAGGGYGRRAGWFCYVSLIFLFDLLVQCFHNLYRSGSLFRASTWAEGLVFLFGRHGVLWHGFGAWAAYLRPGFVPGDRGSEAMAQTWLVAHSSWFQY